MDVGEAALNDGEFTRGLDILRLLEPITSKTPRELLSLGTAYLWAALDQKVSEEQRSEHLKKALVSLEDASREDKTRAITFWTLGFVYDELRRYPPAIEANEEALRLDPRFLPWANWHIAISLLKLAKLQQDMGDHGEAAAKTGAAMAKLQAIPSGLWWDELEKDPDLQELRDHPTHGPNLSELANERRTGGESK